MVAEKRVLSREEVRAIDHRAIEEFRLPGIVLMENAGRNCADLLCQLGIRGPVVICCGKGNNAGDGLVVARHLDSRGFATRLLFWADPGDLRGDAATNLEIARRAELPIEVLQGPLDRARLDKQLDAADWIVDALLGTGARGTPRSPLDAVIDQLNAHGANKLAIDVPSGLDCETGEASDHTFRADHTCTFVAPKTGLVMARSAAWVGQLHVRDIGAPRKLLQQFGLPVPVAGE